MDDHDLLPTATHRPAPARPLATRCRDWVEWFGVARLLATSMAILSVGLGGWWLLRTPEIPVERSLPYAAEAPSTSSPPPSLTSPEPPADVVVVHVAGAVIAPGVYTLSGHVRVVDAVAAAGGFAVDAETEVVNLAALLVDGQRVYVPKVGERAPDVVVGGQPSLPADAAPAGPINVNTASADQLDSLPGVGPATAAAIISHREQNGPFASVDALGDVRGIGPAKLEALRPLVTT